MNTDKYTIKELKKHLNSLDVDETIIRKLYSDKRKGVRQLADKYSRIRQKERDKVNKWRQMNKIKRKLNNKGYRIIAGIDEAGRGPLAGPVVAAAVVLKQEHKILGLDDSKKLSTKKREYLFKQIKERARAIGVGIVGNRTIDKINIQNATYKAMEKAIGRLELTPEYLLVDGNREIPALKIKQKTVIDGDSRVNSIAAASIIAKVTRDNIIDEYDADYPEYGFIDNKGYGTRKHIQALKKYGPTEIHRYSYSVVKKAEAGDSNA